MEFSKNWFGSITIDRSRWVISVRNIASEGSESLQNDQKPRNSSISVRMFWQKTLQTSIYVHNKSHQLPGRSRQHLKSFRYAIYRRAWRQFEIQGVYENSLPSNSECFRLKYLARFSWRFRSEERRFVILDTNRDNHCPGVGLQQRKHSLRTLCAS